MKYLLLLLLISCQASVPSDPRMPYGTDSLITSTRFDSDTLVCASGSGIIIKSGPDINQNRKLDTLEVQNTSILCNGAAGKDGKDGAVCSTTQMNDGASITCSDGSKATIKDGAAGVGTQGLPGAAGRGCYVQPTAGGQEIVCGSSTATVLNGTDGLSCSTTQTSSGATITCANGTTATILNGTQGVTGATGSQGIAGTSCTVTSVVGGSKIVCGGTESLVTNGTSPTAAYNIVRAIEPCGHNSSPYKEVLLLLASGDILASFSDTQSGYNTRLAFIPNGNSYLDTDSSGCAFSIGGTGSSRVVSWRAGSNSYSTWPAGSVSAAP
jgi:hypothetical protein